MSMGLLLAVMSSEKVLVLVLVVLRHGRSEKSYMHRDWVTHVAVSDANFFMTGSRDGKPVGGRGGMMHPPESQTHFLTHSHTHTLTHSHTHTLTHSHASMEHASRLIHLLLP